MCFFRYGLKAMVEFGNGGRIVNTSSISGITGCGAEIGHKLLLPSDGQVFCKMSKPGLNLAGLKKPGLQNRRARTCRSLLSTIIKLL